LLLPSTENVGGGVVEDVAALVVNDEDVGRGVVEAVAALVVFDEGVGGGVVEDVAALVVNDEDVGRGVVENVAALVVELPPPSGSCGQLQLHAWTRQLYPLPPTYSAHGSCGDSGM
jgi:hypothetical protein